MSKIDLSFLKHKQLPFKVLTHEIAGKQQKFTIYPINGRGLTSIGLIGDDDLDKNSKVCLLALIYGLKINQQEAELFINAQTVAADAIAAEILSFTQEYQNTLAEATIEVKKNSKTKTTK